MNEVGIISEIKGERARVKIAEGLVTDFLPVVQFANSFSRVWKPIRVGEQVVVIPIRSNINAGVILRGIFFDESKPPTTKNDQEFIIYEDGTSFSYSTKTKELVVSLVGSVNITINTTASIDAQDINISAKGNATVTSGGNATVTSGGNATITVGGNTTITSNDVQINSAKSTFSGAVIANAITVGGAGGAELTANEGSLVFNKPTIFQKKVNMNEDLSVNGTITDKKGDLTNHTNDGYPRD